MGWSWKGWFRKLSCVTKGDLLTSSPMLNHDPTRFWVAGLNWKDKSRRGITWWESQTNALRGVGWTHSSEEDQADDIQNLYRIVIYQKGKPLKRVSENAIWQRSWRLSNNCWRPNLADISIWYISSCYGICQMKAEYGKSVRSVWWGGGGWKTSALLYDRELNPMLSKGYRKLRLLKRSKYSALIARRFEPWRIDPKMWRILYRTTNQNM